MTNSKLNLNLNSDNELTFKVLIEGTTTELENTNPIFRFVISEVSDEHGGVIYPAVQQNDGNVTVKIPNSKLFSEKKDYVGKLEVILGNHYFVPAEIGLDFVQPLKVEAVAVSSNKQTKTLDEKNNENGADKLAVSMEKVFLTKNKNHKKRTWNQLTESEKKKIIEYKKKQKLIQLKKHSKDSSIAAKTQAEENKVKKQLKNMIKSSLKE